MTDYQFEGEAVLVKPPILTGSAQVADGVTVEPGDVLEYAGATSQEVQLGTDASTRVAGIALEGRVGSSTETRPVTFVIIGWVRAVASGAIGSDRLVEPAADGELKASTGGAAECGRYIALGDGTRGAAANGNTIQVWIDATRNGGDA